MVVTTGRSTNPAQEYAQRLQQNDDLRPIKLPNAEDLREIADESGLNLYNGRIKILRGETLRPCDIAGLVERNLALVGHLVRTTRDFLYAGKVVVKIVWELFEVPVAASERSASETVTVDSAGVALLGILEVQ
jgi:hypothetical protein